MSPVEKHLIFGTGPVGKAIMTSLLKRGKSVTMVNRSGKMDDTPNGVTVVKGDVKDEAFTAQLAQGFTHLYNATNPPYENWHFEFPPLNTSILKAATKANARLIVMDNLYMYGPQDGKPITEGLPYRPNGKKSLTRANMADELLEAHKRGEVKVVLGRASDFFGAGVMGSSVGERLFYPAVEGKAAQMMFNVDFPHTYSYVPDIGEGLVLLGENDDTYGKAWHLPSPRTVTTREFVRLVYAAAGYPMKMQVIGKRMSQVLSLFVPILREVQEMSYAGMNAYVVDATPFIQRFGDISTPLEQAITETVAWFKAHPHKA
jgi:nucleoside-diphosphate-sugar epimerase